MLRTKKSCESRMREICTSGLTRGGLATVIGFMPLIPWRPSYSTDLCVLKSLLVAAIGRAGRSVVPDRLFQKRRAKLLLENRFPARPGIFA